MPWAAARLSAGATALASLPAIAITFTPWETKLLMNSIWASAVAADGACWTTLPPISLAASSAPSLATWKYGSVSSFGRKPTVTGAVAQVMAAAEVAAATDSRAKAQLVANRCLVMVWYSLMWTLGRG